jgi:hypothetical protein
MLMRFGLSVESLEYLYWRVDRVGVAGLRLRRGRVRMVLEHK